MGEQATDGAVIWINGEVRSVEGAVALDALLEALYGDVPLRGVAVALDGAVVPRSRWTQQVIAPGARLEIIRATQGG